MKQRQRQRHGELLTRLDHTCSAYGLRKGGRLFAAWPTVSCHLENHTTSFRPDKQLIRKKPDTKWYRGNVNTITITRYQWHNFYEYQDIPMDYHKTTQMHPLNRSQVLLKDGQLVPGSSIKQGRIFSWRGPLNKASRRAKTRCSRTPANPCGKVYSARRQRELIVFPPR